MTSIFVLFVLHKYVCYVRMLCYKSACPHIYFSLQCNSVTMHFKRPK